MCDGVWFAWAVAWARALQRPVLQLQKLFRVRLALRKLRPQVRLALLVGGLHISGSLKFDGRRYERA